MKKLIFTAWCLILTSILSTHNLYAQCTPVTYNDPENQFQYDAMNIPCAWSLTNGSSDIIVAAFDRYFDNAHPELVGKVVDIVGDCDFTGAIHASVTHGNQSLGAIAGIRNNDNCLAGSGGDTRVIGMCGYASNSSLTQAVSHGADILSVSAWGGISKSKVEELTFNGVPVLLAGLCNYHGADDPDGYHSVPGAIHVGRTYLDGSYWPYYSNCDNSIPNENRDVLVMTDFLSRIGEAASCELSGGGTSIGTPTLAGVVALMKSVNGCLSPGDIEEILVQTSAPSNNQASRGGLINAYEAVLMAQTFVKLDREWTGNKTYDYYEVSGNLEVLSGADITINKGFRLGENSTMYINSGAVVRFESGSTSYFADESKIIVKRGGHLILNGAKFTTGSCQGATQWSGIKIEGNSAQNQQLPNNTISSTRNGIVEITNNSIIENAKTAVSMDPNHLGWPTLTNYRGGLVLASNSTFRNNDRAFEFLEYRFRDNSRISNCTFDGHINVATHWANFGVRYDNSTFLNYSKNAVSTYDAQVFIKNANTFDSDGHTEYDQAAVDFYHTYPNVFVNGSEVGGYNSSPNLFFGGFHGVFCDGCASGLETNIVNNQFLGIEYGVTMQGTGSHLIDKNDFVGNTNGVLMADNGSFGNIMANNHFSSNVIGSFIYRDNSGFQFLDNCFDYSTAVDVRLHDADLSDDIGSPSLAAGNTFSYPNFRSIRKSGSTVPSDYHILTSLEQNPSSSRQVPRDYDENVFDSDNVNPSDCGSWNSPGPIKVRPFGCKLPATCEDLLTYIENVENEIAFNQQILAGYVINSINWYITRIKISGLKRCLRKAKIKLIALCGSDDDDGGNRMIEMFEDDQFIYQTYIFGMLVDKKDYSRARIFLNELEPVTEEEIDFITTQNINISRLISGELELSTDDLNTLYTIGLKTNPLSAYARSLYKLTTGEKVPLDLSVEEEEENSTPRSRIESRTVTISPNPFSSEMKINLQGFEKDVTIQISTIVGQSVKKVTLNPDKVTSFIWSPTEDIQSGIYLISVNSNGFVKTEKVVYQNK